MYIINQDRNMVIQMTNPVVMAPAIHGGKLVGFNLYATSGDNSYLLGTFDTDDEAIAELNAIAESTEEYYFVNGFYDDPELDDEDAELWVILTREADHED
jgi:hypothetical protein